MISAALENQEAKIGKGEMLYPEVKVCPICKGALLTFHLVLLHFQDDDGCQEQRYASRDL